MGVPRAERDDQGDPEAHGAVVSAAVAREGGGEGARGGVQRRRGEGEDALERDEEDRARNQKALESRKRRATGARPGGTRRGGQTNGPRSSRTARSIARARNETNPRSR